MVLSEYVDLHIFVISFALGLMLVYGISVPPRIVNKFPTPENSNTVFRDEHHSCYRFVPKQTPCTAKAIPQPIIENMRDQKK